MKTTFDDYKEAILKQYEIAKLGRDADLLLNPTPGNLKKLCGQLSETNMSKSDKEIFEKFFLFKPNSSHSYQIRNTDLGKFKTPSEFLKMKSNLQDYVHANLIAVLVNFQPRPFLKFNGMLPEEKDDETARNLKGEATVGKLQNELEENSLMTKGPESVESTGSSRFPRVTFIIAVLVLIVAFSGYLISKSLEEECMVWDEDHYEKIDCKKNSSFGIMRYDRIIAYNEEIYNCLCKIKVDSTTEFFKDGEALVWYSRKDNEFEFFSCPGNHPITGKALRKVSDGIVNKYVLNKE